MSRIITISLVWSWLLIPLCHGQTKFEREYRIKEQNVPEKAIDFVDKSVGEKRVKWYKEESQEGITIEAKTCFNDKKFSIEFDSQGVLLDVEKKVSFKTLAKEIQESITSTLNSEFLDFKIKKTQIQWKGDPNTLIELIQKGATQKEYTLHFEIIIKAKKKTIFEPYEILLDKEGKLVKSMLISTRNTDNLQF